MILKLSVGEAVQVSHIVKMRLGSQKGNDHTAVFMCSDLNESQDTGRMVLSSLPLEEGGKKRDFATCCRPWARTQPLMEKRTHEDEKPAGGKLRQVGQLMWSEGERVTPVRSHCKAFYSFWWRICQHLAEAESGPGILLTLLHLTNKGHSFFSRAVLL